MDRLVEPVEEADAALIGIGDLALASCLVILVVQLMRIATEGAVTEGAFLFFGILYVLGVVARVAGRSKPLRLPPTPA